MASRAGELRTQGQGRAVRSRSDVGVVRQCSTRIEDMVESSPFNGRLSDGGWGCIHERRRGTHIVVVLGTRVNRLVVFPVALVFTASCTGKTSRKLL